MTEDLNKQIVELKAENDKLQKQAAQNAGGVEGLLAQLDAHKGMLNEALTSSVQYRTNAILLQKQCQTLANEKAELQKQIDVLKAPPAPVTAPAKVAAVK